MFSTSVRSALITLVASAIAVSAAPGLSLKVSGPEAVDGVGNLKVVATLINTGDETLKLLNHPNSPLSTFATNTFNIQREDSGATPTFNGVKVKYVPTVAAKVGGESAITVLAPGQSVSVEHDLSSAYNFTSSGEGKYTVEANNLFHYINDANEVSQLHADAEVHTAALKGTLSVAKRSHYGKRATFTGCSSSQQSGLNTAASSAQTYAANAYSYLQSHTSATTRYTTWFGTYTSSRHSTVQSHFQHISSNDFSSFHFDCTCTDSGTYAYVYPDDFGHVYLCGAFWQAPNTGTDSRAGTLIHESSHFTQNGGTDDHVYGQTAAKNLAKSNPDQAIDNADNHEYFAENNPALS
ncbi:peptidyl-Lys metalloendopeptidase [Panus rudis PR-1116 ss-1]|nr:peptidyl-Lys metalloendopeptidase [Panus rudis PR-1116 ss-1]